MVRGHLGSSAITIQYSAYDFLFSFNKNYVHVLYHFQDTASCLSPIFTYPQLGVTLFAFHQDVRKLENIWAIVWHC